MEVPNPWTVRSWQGLTPGDVINVKGVPNPSTFYGFDNKKDKVLIFDKYGMYHEVEMERVNV